MRLPKDTRTGAVDGSHLAANLARLRQARHMTKADLAAAAKVSPRTIHNLELGRKTRIRDTTLISIAGAFGVELAELLAPTADTVVVEPSGHRPGLAGRRTLLIMFAALTLVAAAELAARFHADWAVEDSTVVGRHPVLGNALWSFDSGGQIALVTVAPWSSRQLLVGVTRQKGSSGYVACLDRARGTVRWKMGPDLDQLIRAFDRETVMDAPFSFHQLIEADLDGDGTREAVVRFGHGLWYPNAICALGPDGPTHQYANLGHLGALTCYDLDDDGADEVIFAGTNNTKSYMGAQVVVLDGDHFAGASVDPLSKPLSGEPDGSLYRLVLPMYPPEIMARMNGARLRSTRIEIIDEDGAAPVIRVPVGMGPGDRILVDLTADLTPLGSTCTEEFRARMADWPDSLTRGFGPADDPWRASWLAGHYRFVKGQMVHGDSLLATVPRYAGDTMEN